MSKRKREEKDKNEAIQYQGGSFSVDKNFIESLKHHDQKQRSLDEWKHMAMDFLEEIEFATDRVIRFKSRSMAVSLLIDNFEAPGFADGSVTEGCVTEKFRIRISDPPTGKKTNLSFETKYDFSIAGHSGGIEDVNSIEIFNLKLAEEMRTRQIGKIMIEAIHKSKYEADFEACLCKRQIQDAVFGSLQIEK